MVGLHRRGASQHRGLLQPSLSPDVCLASHQNGGWIGRDHPNVDPASLAKKAPPDRSGGAFD